MSLQEERKYLQSEKIKLTTEKNTLQVCLNQIQDSLGLGEGRKHHA
jgi:hypothetical protein